MDITIILIIVIGTVAVLLTTSIILSIRGSIRTETIKKYLKKFLPLLKRQEFLPKRNRKTVQATIF